jgi:hypothetical protein
LRRVRVASDRLTVQRRKRQGQPSPAASPCISRWIPESPHPGQCSHSILPPVKPCDDLSPPSTVAPNQIN